MFIVASILVALLSEKIKMREVALQESEERFRAVVENAMTGFSIIQDEKVVYQNPEQKKLLGPLPRSPKFTELESIHHDDAEKMQACLLEKTKNDPLCKFPYPFISPPT